LKHVPMLGILSDSRGPMMLVKCWFMHSFSYLIGIINENPIGVNLINTSSFGFTRC
jgi:hypothetical protein